ncbi:MAG: hypothetical protein V1898_00715 [Patescibacteria group bacterium]
MFLKLNKDLLKQSLQRLGITDRVVSQNTIEIVNEYLVNSFGVRIKSVVSPLYVKNDLLYIQTVNSSLVVELKKREQEIIQVVYQNNQQKIKRLVFVS